jgi:FeS assembly SUF system protein
MFAGSRSVFLSRSLTEAYAVSYSSSERIPSDILGITSKGAISMAEINEQEVMDALRECYDPEIPVNIVDLGLVYNVDINDDTGQVEVTMTLTAMGCPMAGEVISEVEMRVGEVENVKSCKVEMTFDPPWSPDKMTEDAKWELGMV